MQNKNWNSIIRCVKALDANFVSKNNNSIFINSDVRYSLQYLPENSIDCIVTSPPYGSLKDYNSKEQIGYGQNPDDEYFPDLETALVELRRIAKPGAALWLVLDTWKSTSNALPLPWELLNRALGVGWQFQEFVVWDKGRSLPWSHKGRLRTVCEYILVLSKGPIGQFDLDSARDIEHLSPYWVKYPERYHPDGKAPTDLWHFPIPTQGSWGQGGIRHYCPFPLGLVARMVALTTNPGAIVLDPFSGTGSVIAVASFMDRFGLGFDVNEDYVRKFNDDGYTNLINRAKLEIKTGDISRKHSNLRHIIIELRILKFARALYSQLARKDRLNGKAREFIGAFVLKSTTKASIKRAHLDTRKIGTIKLDVLALSSTDLEKLESEINERLVNAPLSKFGLKVEVSVIPASRWEKNNYFQQLPRKSWYVYRKGKFHQYDDRISFKNLADTILEDSKNRSLVIPSIFSQIRQNVASPTAD